MRVVLDTSAIISSSSQMTSPAFRSVLENSGRLGYKLMLPAVVIEELIAKFEERLVQFSTEANKAVSNFRSVTGYGVDDPISSGLIEHGVHDYKFRIQKVLNEAGGFVLEYPKVPLEVLSSMAVKKRKPFGNKADSYRDAIIWFSIFELLRQDPAPLIFVTGNIHDFAEEKSNPPKLHPDLVLHLVEHYMHGDEVELFTSIEHFNLKVIIPLLDDDDDVSERLADGRPEGLVFRKALGEELDVLIEQVIAKLNPLVLGVPRAARNIGFEGVRVPYRVYEVEVNRIDDDEVWVSASLSFDFRMSFEMETLVSLPFNSRYRPVATETGYFGEVKRDGYATVEVILNRRDLKFENFRVRTLQLGRWFMGHPNLTIEEFLENVESVTGHAETNEEYWLS